MHTLEEKTPKSNKHVLVKDINGNYWMGMCVILGTYLIFESIPRGKVLKGSDIYGWKYIEE